MTNYDKIFLQILGFELLLEVHVSSVIVVGLQFVKKKWLQLNLQHQ